MSFGGQQVLSNLALTLMPGDVILLRGENGSGKTTLLNVLGGHLRPDRGTVEYSLNGSRIVHAFGSSRMQERQGYLAHARSWVGGAGKRAPELLARLGLSRTWQDLRLFKNLAAIENVAVAAQGHPGEIPINAFLRPRATASFEKSNRQRASERLAAAGLHSVANSLADQISLGQGKRLVIERALFAGARVLFLDEPLSGLDAEGAARMIAILRQLALDHGVSLVIVEHVANIPRILSFATSVWTLERGKIVATPLNTAKADAESATAALENWLAGATTGNGRLLERIRLSDGARLSVLRRGPAQGQDLLTVSNLTPCRGKRPVFKDLSFSLQRGEIALFEAPNGWGKTTALEAIAGMLKRYSGVVALNSQSLNGQSPWVRRRAGLSYLRARDHSFVGMRVSEVCKLSDVVPCPAVLEHLWERRIDQLSGGEKQLVAFVCAIKAPNVKMILLDEPFSALDSARSAEMREAILEVLVDVAVLIATPIAAEDPNLTLASEP